jgi:hypothetical protein
MGCFTSGEMHLLVTWDGWDTKIDNCTVAKCFKQSNFLVASFFKRSEGDLATAIRPFFDICWTASG